MKEYNEVEIRQAIATILGIGIENSELYKTRMRIITELKLIRQDRLAAEKVHTSDSKSVVSTARLSTKGQLTIPEKVRKHLDWKEGDKFMVMAESGRIIIIKEVS